MKPYSQIITTAFAQTYLKKSKNYFDNVLKSAVFTQIGDGNCLVEITPSAEHANPMKIIHGGFLTTLVETLTSYALCSHKNCGFIESYSIDTHMSYFKPVQVGQDLIVDSRTIKAGKSIAFIECFIINKPTGELLVKGNHTKMLLRDKKITFN